MGGDGDRERVPDDDSSGEEDGDEQWRAAINSVAGVFSDANASRPPRPEDDGGNSNDDRDERKPHKFKHYQIKAQMALSDMLEKTLEMVTVPINFIDEEEDPVSSEGGIRLFKRAPPGIVFDHAEKHEGPKGKPRIVPGEEVDDKSKKFRKRLQSIAVDGTDILAAAENVRLKNLARLEAKEAAVKKEERRVAELKRIRGERWLPSIAKEMKFQLKTTLKQR